MLPRADAELLTDESADRAVGRDGPAVDDPPTPGAQAPGALSLLGRVRRRLGSEGGFALPTVIGVMAASLAFAGVAALASVNTLRGTVRDEDSKTALAAADAGAMAALVRQNTIAGSGSNACLTSGSGGLLTTSTAQPDGWCAPVTGSIDGATYSYQTFPESDGTIRVVSVGESDGVNRRIELSGSDASGSNPFANASVIGRDWINMDSNSQVHANAATNGSISLNSNAFLCGNASVGVGQSLTTAGNSSHGGPNCDEPSYGVTEAPLTLPGVQQGDAATNNDNGRFFDQDLIGGKANKVSWDPNTRMLELKSNVSLTLGGDKPYSFCQLILSSNSSLFIAAGANVQIFFDAPENCNGQTQPLIMNSNSTIRATSGNATHVSLLFVGSDTVTTTMQLDSNSQPNEGCSSEFVIYAPKTEVTFNSNVTYCGAIAGKNLNLDSNTNLSTQTEIDDFILPGAGPHYVADRFVECTAAENPSAEGC